MPSARAQRSEPKASEPPAGALKREATAKAAETPMPAKVHTSSLVFLNAKKYSTILLILGKPSPTFL